MTSSKETAFLVIHVLGLLLSVVSNGSIVSVIVKHRHLRTPSAVPLLALVISDLLLCLVWHCTALINLSLQHMELDLNHGPTNANHRYCF